MGSHAQRSGRVSAADLAGALNYKNAAQKQSPPAGLGAGEKSGSYSGPLSGGKAGAGSGGGSVRGGSERMDGQGLPDSKMGRVGRKYANH